MIKLYDLPKKLNAKINTILNLNKLTSNDIGALIAIIDTFIDDHTNKRHSHNRDIQRIKKLLRIILCTLNDISYALEEGFIEIDSAKSELITIMDTQIKVKLTKFIDHTDITYPDEDIALALANAVKNSNLVVTNDAVSGKDDKVIKKMLGYETLVEKLPKNTRKGYCLVKAPVIPKFINYKVGNVASLKRVGIVATTLFDTYSYIILEDQLLIGVETNIQTDLFDTLLPKINAKRDKDDPLFLVSDQTNRLGSVTYHWVMPETKINALVKFFNTAAIEEWGFPHKTVKTSEKGISQSQLLAIFDVAFDKYSKVSPDRFSQVPFIIASKFVNQLDLETVYKILNGGIYGHKTVEQRIKLTKLIENKAILQPKRAELNQLYAKWKMQQDSERLLKRLNYG